MSSFSTKIPQFRENIHEARAALKNAYLFFTVLGGLFIYMVVSNAGMEQSVENDPSQINESLQAMLAGIIPMIFYLIYGVSQHPSHQDKRGLSDSFYYLGFTFTLLSLFLAIAFDKLTIGANTASFNAVLTYFGTALSTTIFGIIVRTMNTQFLYEIEEEISLLPKIEEKRMKDNVDKFIESLSELNNEINLMTSLMASDLKPTLEELSLLISKTKDPFDTLSNQINNQTNDLSDTISSLNLSFKSMEDQISENLIDIIKPFESAVDEISHKLKNSTEPIDNAVIEIQNELKGISKPLLSSIDSINEQLNSAELAIETTTLTQLFKSINTLKNKVTSLTSEMDIAIQNLSSITDKSSQKYLKNLEEINKKEKNIKKRGFFSSMFRD